MKLPRILVPALVIVALGTSQANCDLSVGTLSDFQSGTVEGWGGGTVVILPNMGPGGTGDFALQLSNGGLGGFFAMSNNSFAGVVDSNVQGISVDIFRAASAGSAEMRLVLHESAFPQSLGARWTSTDAVDVPDDGQWHTHFFPIQEADLTLISGAGTYNDMVTNFGAMTLRYDPGPASAMGSPLAGTMLFDNIIATAIPEPTGMAIGLFMVGALALKRRRLTPNR